jgi:hypothetical protein
MIANPDLDLISKQDPMLEAHLVRAALQVENAKTTLLLNPSRPNTSLIGQT